MMNLFFGNLFFAVTSLLYNSWEIGLSTFTGIGPNHWTWMFIFIGIGNLYPALNYTVGGTCTDPNKLPK